MAQAPGRKQFFTDVYPDEIAEIAKRRERRGLPHAALDAAVEGGGAVAPSTEHATVGLALSGGGIRSATFTLGILQSLVKNRLLGCVDYLSSVSGGGYIASTLTVALSRERPEDGPPGHSLISSQDGQDPELVKHLRSFANYLAPNGLLDLFRIPAILLRGIATNVLVLSPLLALIAIVAAHLYPELPDGQHTFVLTPWVFLALAIWVALFPLISTVFEKSAFARRSLYEGSFALLLLLGLATFAVELLPFIYHRLFRQLALDTPHYASTAGAMLVAIAPMATSIASSAFRGAVNRVLVIVAGMLGPIILLFVYLGLVHWLLKGGVDEILHARMLTLALVMGGVYIFTRAFVSINKSGMHSFYRDRLSLAYLFDPISLQHADDFRLQQCAPAKSGAPYHLINAALNMPATENRELQGRATDFFMFSPRWCGSWQTGYAATDALEKENAYVNQGTAMAISGAAASPVMGTNTSRLFVFLLTLLNVRLDYWLVNPARMTRAQGLIPWLRDALLFQVGPVYLLFELFGRLNERSKYVNLSDGGHLENLGLYELLRRRCRYIICTDAGLDPGFSLPALGQLQAYARTDLGIDFRWTNLDALASGENGRSPVQWAHGRIDYGDGQEGQIVYLKLGLSGREPRDVLSYAAKNPDFPHQSTGDQFFDDNQFESYRALGEFISEQLFEDNPLSGDDLEQWFERLAARAGES